MPVATTGASLTDQVARSVREAIQTGRLRPGQLYSVVRLAEEFEVSRTPVREAMLQLAEVGLVRFERNRGFRILSGGAREIIEVFELRILLEVPGAGAAAGLRTAEHLDALRVEHETMIEAAARGEQREFMRLDERFHNILLGAAGNQRLLSIVSNLRAATASLGVSAVGFARILREHEAIFKAFKEQNEHACAKAMNRHLRATAKLLVSRFKDADTAPPSLGPLVQLPTWKE